MLKRIGVVLHVAKDGLVVVKAQVENPDRLYGLTAFDYSMRRVGSIRDVIGPVSSPYFLIKPAKGVNVSEFVGKAIYVREVDFNRAMRSRGVLHG